MELSIQLFTGSAMNPEKINTQDILNKLEMICDKTKISGAYIGWNKDADISVIIDFLKKKGTDIYFWLPVFSELSLLTEFEPLIGINGKKIEKVYDSGSDELFVFCCPANPKNVELAIKVFEEHYDNGLYDGIFLDKIRYPSFIGGLSTITSCYCDYCCSSFDLPAENELLYTDVKNPMGINRYTDLRYEMAPAYQRLFDIKAQAVYSSLERLCSYFKDRGYKICLDLFAPAVAFFVGQDYHRLLELTDIVKPMLYNKANAPAGLPFEINAYAGSFDSSVENVNARRAHFSNITGCDDKDFISKEVANIKKIIRQNGLKTKLHAGIEINYVEDIAPITEIYIKDSVINVKEADGIIASWNLNTMPESNIKCLLDAI